MVMEAEVGKMQGYKPKNSGSLWKVEEARTDSPPEPLEFVSAAIGNKQAQGRDA